MSEADRGKWNARYREGAYAQRPHPSALLEKRLPDILANLRKSAGAERPLRALDLACGAGRNALYLAQQGFEVDAVDVASEALTRGEATARELGLRVCWIERDLDEGLPARLLDYDLILILRYLDPALVSEAAQRLRPGGHLLCETHLQTDREVAGPRNPAFRARPGELRAAAQALDIIEFREGLSRDPDQRLVALAQLLARRPAGPQVPHTN